MKATFARTMITLSAVALTLGAIKPVAHADAVGGPKRSAIETVSPHGTDIYHIRFYGHELAEVVANAVTDDDIDMDVYDADGNLVASDHLPDSTPICDFVPRYTQTYTVKVRNATAYYVDYRVTTN